MLLMRVTVSGCPRHHIADPPSITLTSHCMLGCTQSSTSCACAWTPCRIAHVPVILLCAYHASLQAKDLQEWAESPERFHHETESSAWQEHLRSCAQVLLYVLVEVCASRSTDQSMCAQYKSQSLPGGEDC